MMWWNGGWGWMWLFMVPMWALVAWAIVHFARNGRVGPAETVGPLGTLDGRLAAGEITVEEHRARRAELERR